MDFSGIDISRFAEKHPTPFFLFSRPILEANYGELKSAFSRGDVKVRIDYSMKTNLELGVLEILKDLGLDLEIAAAHELNIAEMAGFTPNQVVYDGPSKNSEALRDVISADIRAVYADNHEELVRLQDTANSLGKMVRVCLRVSMGSAGIFENPGEKNIVKFGIPLDEIEAEADFLRERCHNIELVGLSHHVGSQQLSPRAHLRALKKITGLARRIEATAGPIREICLGGGFPSTSLSKTTLPDLFLSQFGLKWRRNAAPLARFGEVLTGTFAKLVQGMAGDPCLVIQPGRSIVSSMGVAVSRIMAVKGSWVMLDISTSSLPESIFFAQRELVPVDRADEPVAGKFNFAGSGLNTADNFALKLPWPEPHAGDLVMILDAGAYSISRANRFTVLNPPVYLIDGDEVRTIRRQETVDDVISPMLR